MKKIFLGIALILALIIPAASFAGTETTNLQLYKPADAETGWGGNVRTNFDRLDYLADGWAIYPDTVTYVGTQQFKVTGDWTTRFTVDRAIKANLNGTLVYSYVSAASYSAPDTTVTIDDTVLTADLTEIYTGVLDSDTSEKAYPANMRVAEADTLKVGVSYRSASTTAGANTIPCTAADATLPTGFIPYKAGQTVQTQITQSGAYASGSTQVPYDDTIMQKTEGTEFLTVTITPTSATNKLDIWGVWNGSTSLTTIATMGIFQDTTANALAECFTTLWYSTGAWPGQIICHHNFTSGTTSATTFKMRVGPHNAATIYMNGSTAARVFGGTAASSISVTEIQQ